ncbi:hypothetical protein BVC80_8835g7 [Macleaya cordata]|uniref:Zinc finger protein n=1 Tax=Macleaya cordata TaxID=56857 RepID=A0A200RE09_MACCD|nr:hypothetical protein BVC80_8835g7 [Macleaya cordata]
MVQCHMCDELGHTAIVCPWSHLNFYKKENAGVVESPTILCSSVRSTSLHARKEGATEL